jgi:uncharacterized protein (TIGR00255 family)
LSVAYSMTGFASVEGVLTPDGRGFTVTVKSVNHRHLDLQIRAPSGFDALEAGLRTVVKAGVRRGHLELTMYLEKGGSSASVQVDAVLLEAYVRAFLEAAEQFGLKGEPDLNGLLRIPGVMSAGAVPVDVAAAEAPVLAVAEEAIQRLNAVREAEGAALVAELRAAMARVASMAEQARELREGVSAAAMERLKVRLAEMLGEGSHGVGGLSEERLLAEVALLVERGDVEEELVRLRTHVDRFIELLEGGGELGRQLDFLLQELNREANTMLSKTGGSAGETGLRLTELGLAMKVELERAREQVQNLE